MKAFLKQIVLTVIIFLGLFSVSPMVSSYEGAPNCGKDFGPLAGAGNCSPMTMNTVVFPVWRTFACEMWHQPGCAPDTLLRGEYDNLLNLMNVPIVLTLVGLAAFAGHKITHRKD